MNKKIKFYNQLSILNKIKFKNGFLVRKDTSNIKINCEHTYYKYFSYDIIK